MIKKTICYFFIYVSFCSLHLKAQTNDSILIESFIDKCKYFEQVNVDSSMAYGLRAYKLAEELNNQYMLCKATLRLGIAYQNISDYKKSAVYYKDGIRLAEKVNDKKLLSQAYNSFGNLFGVQKQFAQASEYFNKALVVSKEIKDARKVSVILSNLANVEYSKAFYSNDYKKCNIDYKEAYDWAVVAKDTDQQISVTGSWGMSLDDEGNFKASVEKLTTAIELAQSKNNQSDLVFLRYYLGRTYFSMKNFEKAKAVYFESLKLAIEFKDLDYQSENYYGLAESN